MLRKEQPYDLYTQNIFRWWSQQEWNGRGM